MKNPTILFLTLLSVFGMALPALADDDHGASEKRALTPSAATLGIEKAELPPTGGVVLENDEPILFKNASGSLDGTEIRRPSGNALRFLYNGNAAIFDALNNNSFQIRNSAGVPFFSVNPSGNVKLDISSNGFNTGIRFLRSDAKDARIQVGDPTKSWSMAVGWGGSGDFSLVEEGVAGNHLYIKQGGNVGIGTSNPSERFQVTGNIKLSGDLLSADNDIQIKNTATGSVVKLLSNGDICIGSGCP